MSGWKVPIGGHLYDVIFVTEGPAGEIDPNAKTITFNSREHKTEELFLATYLHEIIHGYQFESGWHELVGSRLREIWAEGLASQLLGSFEIKIKKY
jgi:hypothetical protein